MNDTRTLTSANVSLRPDDRGNGLVVDLQDKSYYPNFRRSSVGALIEHDRGMYVAYSWGTGDMNPVTPHDMPLHDAIIALCQHLSPYTFTS